MQQDHNETLAEFTLKAIAAGVVLGIVFGAANAYLGLKVGMTVSASIPAAVLTVAVFRVFRVRGTILEANISQTIGSASTSLATGTIFTVPALFLWGTAPPYLQVVALCLLGGVIPRGRLVPRCCGLPPPGAGAASGSSAACWWARPSSCWSRWPS